MCEAGHEDPENPSRRSWLKTCMAAGLGAAAGAAVGGLAATLVGPEFERYELREAFSYPPNRSPSGAWWDPLVDQKMKVTDFGLWQGAPGLWRAMYDHGKYVAGTGLPVLVVRVPRDDAVFVAPTDVTFPSGVHLFFDDAARDIRLVAFWNRCTHLCCRASWHDQPIPDIFRDYTPPVPTWTVYGQDPIWCMCHDSQFDPMVLIKGIHPLATEQYVGARLVHGPGTDPLPVVPLRTEDDILLGTMVYPGWYRYCR